MSLTLSHTQHPVHLGSTLPPSTYGRLTAPRGQARRPPRSKAIGIQLLTDSAPGPRRRRSHTLQLDLTACVHANHLARRKGSLMNTIASSTQPQVAVLGTGTMGTAMAGRLLSAGMNVAVWSRHRSSTERAVELGALPYNEAADAVSTADVVITMLPTFEAIREVMFDAKALDSMSRGATWAQMSTIGTTATRQLETLTEVRRPDVAFVDAPVSGSREPAESGQLLILASGPSHDAGPLGAVFRTLGKQTMWLGSVGAGSAMKLVMNTWLAFQTEGAAEAAALAEHLGVARSQLRKALSDSPLASKYPR